MVKKIFNVPSGSRPIEFGKRGKADFREVYLGGGDRAPIATAVSVLSKADDDDTIERSWVLLCLALVLALGTGNMVPLDYLYTLRDMSMVHEFEWDEHILCDVMREVKNTKIRGMRVEGNFSSVDVYQCFWYTPFDSCNIPLLLSATKNLFLEELMFSFLFCVFFHFADNLHGSS